MQDRKYKVKLNSAEKIEELLQETYDQTCRQINEIQNEINKLTVSTNLADTSIEEKAKYAKAIHDYTGDKTKAIMCKFEIAKFMGEILKHNGDVGGALNDQGFTKSTKLDLTKIRAELSKSQDSDKYILNN